MVRVSTNHGEVVRDEDHGQARLPIEVRDQVVELLLILEVDPGRRLIEQEQLG